jgi:hypothetical protein
MHKAKSTTFSYYRYQILPISNVFQLRFDLPVHSLEELKARKNEFFERALFNVAQFNYVKAELVHKILRLGDGIFSIQLGVKRDLRRIRKDFTAENIENWPSVLIFIYNQPDRQLVAIQNDTKVFQHAATVARILEKNLDQALTDYHLNTYLEPTFEKQQFWDKVEQYERRVKQVQFTLITPNMSNISKKLAFDLRKLQTSTQTQTTQLTLNSDEHGSLVLSKKDRLLSTLVDYASKGGGPISLAVRGVTKRIKIGEAERETSVKEIEIKADNAALALELLKDFMDG